MAGRQGLSHAISSPEGTLWLILHSLHMAGIRAKASSLLRPFLAPDWQRTSVLTLNIPGKVKESPNLSSFASISGDRFRLSSFGVRVGPLRKQRDTVTCGLEWQPPDGGEEIPRTAEFLKRVRRECLRLTQAPGTFQGETPKSVQRFSKECTNWKHTRRTLKLKKQEKDFYFIIFFNSQNAKLKDTVTTVKSGWV